MANPMATIMDGIASYALAQNVVIRAYGTPIPAPEPPCLIVGYPTVDFDFTFQRGADTWTYPLWYVVAPIADTAARNQLDAIMLGPTGVKTKLDGSMGGLVSDARVTRMTVESMLIGAVEFMAAKFELEVWA